MAKDLTELKWAEELLPEGYLRKHMFGGFGYYVNDRIVLAIFESNGDYIYNNKKYDFELWNGCLFPTEREHHSEIKKKFPELLIHPVLSKWLYLPTQTEDFESIVTEILKEIRRHSIYFGVTPKSKGKKDKTIKDKNQKKTKVDTRTPQMFREKLEAHKITKSLKAKK